MSHDNPEWVFGQQPTVAEWNAEFGSKQDWNPALDQVINQGGPVAYLPAANWTPDDASGAALVFAQARGAYTVIGGVAFVSLFVEYPATADTSDAKITLPIVPPVVGFGRPSSLAQVVSGACHLAIMTTDPIIDIQDFAGAAITNAALSGLQIVIQITFQYAPA